MIKSSKRSIYKENLTNAVIIWQRYPYGKEKDQEGKERQAAGISYFNYLIKNQHYLAKKNSEIPEKSE